MGAVAPLAKASLASPPPTFAPPPTLAPPPPTLRRDRPPRATTPSRLAPPPPHLAPPRRIASAPPRRIALRHSVSTMMIRAISGKLLPSFGARPRFLRNRADLRRFAVVLAAAAKLWPLCRNTLRCRAASATLRCRAAAATLRCRVSPFDDSRDFGEVAAFAWREAAISPKSRESLPAGGGHRAAAGRRGGGGVTAAGAVVGWWQKGWSWGGG